MIIYLRPLLCHKASFWAHAAREFLKHLGAKEILPSRLAPGRVYQLWSDFSDPLLSRDFARERAKFHPKTFHLSLFFGRNRRISSIVSVALSLHGPYLGTSEKYFFCCTLQILAANSSSFLAVSNLIRLRRSSEFSLKICKVRDENLFFRGSFIWLRAPVVWRVPFPMVSGLSSGSSLHMACEASDHVHHIKEQGGLYWKDCFKATGCSRIWKVFPVRL